MNASHPSALNPPEDTIEKLRIFDGMEVKLQPAPFGKRFIAYCIDLGILTVGIYAIGIIFFLVFGFGAAATGVLSGTRDTGSAFGIAASILLILAFILFIVAIGTIYHGYFWYYETRTGQTPGKRLLGLKVVSADGKKLSRSQVVWRDMFRYVDCTFVFPGLISILVTEKKQRLGDLFVGTIVVYSKIREESVDFVYIKPEIFHLWRDACLNPKMKLELKLEYLKFAYPSFVLGKTPSLQMGTRESWDTRLRDELQFNSSEKPDTETLLRFAAELCQRQET
jgi:uncharacterized RDD family membrane protein YckC